MHNFQDIILNLHHFWSSKGCLIWQPHNQIVGAGTMNPATFLRTLGPEPWSVAYVEPSVRPDDGRYGENPNRLYTHTQYQVILKPTPKNSQDLYLESLAAIGIDYKKHDIRFVEDNWAQPAIGAWGLGWEVWLDGLEITQYTYFQQVGGIALDPICLELTYGLERIAMSLQGVRNVFDLKWDDNRTYGDVRLQDEAERSKYAFESADVDFLNEQFNAIEAECKRTISAGLVLPAHDQVLQLSNIFNLLDARGAIGVTERQRFLGRTRDLAKEIAALYVKQREEAGHPWLGQLKLEINEAVRRENEIVFPTSSEAGPSTLLLEIGVEELPANNVSAGKSQLEKIVPELLKEARLNHGDLKVLATPRRIAVLVEGVASRQNSIDELVKGPAVKIAFDSEGKPAPAAIAFAKKLNVNVEDIEKKDGYIYARRHEEGKLAAEVLTSILPQIIAKLSFEKTMRWNSSGVAFPRPIQWLIGLLGNQPIKFEYAGVCSGTTSYGSRGDGSPRFEIQSAGLYESLLDRQGIIADIDKRRSEVERQINVVAAKIGARVEPDEDLLNEVTNLVEQPAALLASFDKSFLEMPAIILTKVMSGKQRYFTLVDAQTGEMRPNFITVRNGTDLDAAEVIAGNESVVYARFADAAYFYRLDLAQPLQDLLPRLEGLAFQAKLGSMLDKTRRIENIVGSIGGQLKAQDPEIETAKQAAHLCKADLVTKIVVEMTSLQGVMGSIYYVKQDGSHAVATAILEHHRPRFAGDAPPKSVAGRIVALADKLDSIAGLFAVGLEPKGSADPFALRRAAIGVVQCLVDESAAAFSLREALTAVRGELPVQMNDAAFDGALRFIAGRQRAALLEANHPHDVVEAVFAAQSDIPYEAQRNVERLAEAIKRADWPLLLAAFSRCARIVKSSAAPKESISAVADSEPASQHLSAKLSEQPKPRDVDDLVAALVNLEPSITDFFNKVLVNAEDAGLRQARLSLVGRVEELARGVADFSKLEGF